MREKCDLVAREPLHCQSLKRAFSKIELPLIRSSLNDRPDDTETRILNLMRYVRGRFCSDCRKLPFLGNKLAPRASQSTGANHSSDSRANRFFGAPKNEI